MRKLCKLLIAIILLSAFSGAASAHAFLDHADPKVGSTVARSAGADQGVVHPAP